jgi:hypothetical protein
MGLTTTTSVTSMGMCTEYDRSHICMVPRGGARGAIFADGPGELGLNSAHWARSHGIWGWADGSLIVG